VEGCGSRIMLGMEDVISGEQISLGAVFKAGWQRKRNVKV